MLLLMAKSQKKSILFWARVVCFNSCARPDISKSTLCSMYLCVLAKKCMHHSIGYIAAYGSPFSSVFINRIYYDIIGIHIYQQEQNCTSRRKKHTLLYAYWVNSSRTCWYHQGHTKYALISLQIRIQCRSVVLSFVWLSYISAVWYTRQIPENIRFVQSC